MLVRCVVLLGGLLLAGCGSDDATPTDERGSDRVGSTLTISVLRVIDGDSLEIVINGEPDDLRLAGINAPELDRCGGEDAKTALQVVLGGGVEGGFDGQTFDLVVDPDEPRDRFGRLLGTITIENQDIAGPLVANGMVVPLGGSSAVLHEEALQASKERVGIWSPQRCGPAQRGLQIESFVPNPAGSDDRPGAGEFIELRNVLDEDLDLDGWVVHDESTSNRFVLPKRKVGPGEAFRVYSTCGPDESADVFLCDSGSVWTNSGDTAFVVDPNGSTVDFRFSP